MKSNAHINARSDSLNSRRFGTTDLAIVMGLWSAMAIVLGGVISELTSDTETPLARAQSEAYALQLRESVAEEERSLADAAASSGGRGPASAMRAAEQEGALGKDPWGQPYLYRVTRMGVIVWSGGRNGKSESESEIQRLISNHAVDDFHFQGDDVGFLKPVYKKP